VEKHQLELWISWFAFSGEFDIHKICGETEQQEPANGLASKGLHFHSASSRPNLINPDTRMA
jgi:hypothetical protein